MLIYGAINANWIGGKLRSKKRVLKLVLLIPVILMYFLFPIKPLFRPSYPIMALWAAPYIFIGNSLLISLYFILYLIEQNQKQQIENERLFSLSQLIGGIAHNLKTPLMASSGGIEILSANTQKIKKSIEQLDSGHGKNEIPAKDIIEDMEMWEDRVRDYISYMNEVITTVKGQVVPNADNPGEYFKVKDIISRVNILMKHMMLQVYKL